LLKYEDKIMVTLFATPITSPVVIILTIIYFFCESITTYDTRVIQAQRAGLSQDNETMLPKWVGFFVFIGWGTFTALVLLNWKYAILIFIIKFILKVLPVLESIGKFIMMPFRR
jgi:hypothetical protein